MAARRKPTRRRLDVDERRSDILVAARRLFAEATYAEVSIAQVAAAAGSSPALVFHYFGSKAGLYQQIVTETLEHLAEAQRAAADALPPHSSARDRVQAWLVVYLDHIATHPRAWASPLIDGEEPREAVALRRAAQAGYVDALREVLRPADWARHEYALRGYFGFLEFACLAWAQAGCPPDDRGPLIDATLGALEGALGDWGR
ncbi:MAG: helix-turn-helix domain-containing protein [Propionibacteriaceae bacterium]|nr:helix-turn-helix domain-containing protein [Propionibacteriaceae bacterium]